MTPTPTVERVDELERGLSRIIRGATSVLLDAMLNDDPINPKVLQEIIKDAQAALGRGGV
jgi:hypothetical protein